MEGPEDRAPGANSRRRTSTTRLERLLAEYGQLVPQGRPAEVGDYICVNFTFKRDGKQRDEIVNTSEEEFIRIRPSLSFRDGKIEEFDKLMKGVKAGDTREAKVTLSKDAPNEALRGQEVVAEFEVLEVKKLELPELTRIVLKELGDFETKKNCATRSKRPRTAIGIPAAAPHSRARSRAALTEAPIGICRRSCCGAKVAANWSGPCSNCAAAASARPKFVPAKTSCVKTAPLRRPGL